MRKQHFKKVGPFFGGFRNLFLFFYLTIFSIWLLSVIPENFISISLLHFELRTFESPPPRKMLRFSVAHIAAASRDSEKLTPPRDLSHQIALE